MRSWGEVGKDTLSGAGRGAGWGALIGGAGTLAIATIATVATGGAAIPALIAALPAAGGVALTGAEIGGGVGGVMGATGYKEDIDKVAGSIALGMVGTVLGGDVDNHSA